MEIRTVSSDTSGPVLVVPVFADRTPGPGAEEVFAALDWVEDHLETVGFDGSEGSVAVVPTGGGFRFDTVVFTGLGDEADHETVRQASAVARRALPKVDRVATTLHRVDLDGAVRATVEGFLLGGYAFDTYRSDSPERTHPDLELAGEVPGWETEMETARVVAEAVMLARDLVNTPARDKGPADLADRMAAVAAVHGVAAEIWDEGRLAAEQMGGLLGVGAGSHRPPRLLHLSYRPEGARGSLAFVGKGIVFDSGGLSLKPAKSMETMKTDMSGAAAVAAAVVAVARLGVPVAVDAYAALAENMPGGGATRPGDVVTCRNGKTIEVLNTDAEGRLVLADALALAAEAEPDLIVDVATLTGACMVALGERIGGLFASDDDVADRVAAAASGAGERLWRLPLPRDYRSNIDSDVADMKNTGERWGGAINAALLLAEFTDGRPWAHLDIAGPARSSKDRHYLSKGGTGFGVRTLVEVARSMAD